MDQSKVGRRYEDKDVSETINGPFSLSYTRLVSMLTNQLMSYVCIDTPVHAMTENTEDQRQAFLFEISDLLRTLDYPDENLLNEPLEVRLSSLHSRQLVLNFLTSELMAEKMIAKNKMSLKKDDPKELQHELKKLLKDLEFDIPIADVTEQTLFSKLNSISINDKDLLFSLNESRAISNEQWAEIEKINEELSKEYQCRRAMVLKRLDVTIQSFMWSDRAKSMKDEIDKVYSKYRPCMTSKTDIGISDLLSCNKDLLDVDKTSSEKRREKLKCSINKFKIGNVPDRGGRVDINDAPPPEQPAFRSRQDTGDNRGRSNQFNRGQRGGQRGARGQGQQGGEFRGDTGWRSDNQDQARSFYGSDFKNQHGSGYNRGQNSSNRGQNSFNRGHNDQNLNNYDRNQSSGYRGQSSNNFNRGQSSNTSERGQSSPGRGRYRGNQNRGRYAPRSAGPY